MGAKKSEPLGHCLYCGDVMMLNYPEDSTAEERNEMATAHCKCSEATRERDKKLNILRARERIEQLFGLKCSEIGFEPISSDTTRDLMYQVVELLACDIIHAVTITIDNMTKAKLALNAKGEIEVERSKSVKYKLKA